MDGPTTVSIWEVQFVLDGLFKKKKRHGVGRYGGKIEKRGIQEEIGGELQGKI